MLDAGRPLGEILLAGGWRSSRWPTRGQVNRCSDRQQGWQMVKAQLQVKAPSPEPQSEHLLSGRGLGRREASGSGDKVRESAGGVGVPAVRVCVFHIGCVLGPAASSTTAARKAEAVPVSTGPRGPIPATTDKGQAGARAQKAAGEGRKCCTWATL